MLRWNSLSLMSLLLIASYAQSATTQTRYYAHPAVEDEHGVIAPWYTGPNGQIDQRIRVGVETLKRYPWTPEGKAPRPLPEYIYSGSWNIDAEGKITIPPIEDWANGDLAQRAAYILGSMVDYYRYSGDPWAIEVARMQADALLDFCLTPDDHPWPRFLISVPVMGKPYGQADPRGFIQLDIVAEVGIQMVRAAQLCGSDRYMEAARHWADLMAANRLREPWINPWPRYANSHQVAWEDIATGGVAFILEFFDELIKAGYTGRNDGILQARQAGIRYLRDVLLPDWLSHDTWGRNYWDWPCNTQVENVTEFVARYLIDHPEEFPNWRQDARNILTLFINRTSASPGSAGDTYSGAWAYPESSGCCGRSLWYGPLELAPVYGQFAQAVAQMLAGPAGAGTEASAIASLSNEVEWAYELARRKMILATYDFLPTGVVEDNIDGGAIVAGGWFKIAHPMSLKHCLIAIAWMPEFFAPPYQTRIVRSTHTVVEAKYDDPDCLVGFRVAGPAGARATTVIAVPCSPETIRGTINGQPVPLSFKPMLAARGTIVTVEHPAGVTVRLTGKKFEPPDAGQTNHLVGRGGPAGPQRWIFGYPRREDYIDSAGNPWRPATEWCVRVGDNVDTVATTWYTRPRQLAIAGTADPELYRYGAHARDFWADFTVAPGRYHVRLKFAEHRAAVDAAGRALTILINGREVVSGMDIAATAAASLPPAESQPVRITSWLMHLPGMNRAVDLVFNDIEARNGIISVRFQGTHGGEAMVQAIEIGPGDGGRGAVPVTVTPPAAARAPSPDGNLLVNGGFEDGGPRDLGAFGKSGAAAGWHYTFASIGQAYLWEESDYTRHPEWGPVRIRTGKQALRTHADRQGHTILWQDVQVEPQTACTAAVWVRTEDLRGKGFGTTPTDSAGLIVQEYDEKGTLLVEHPRQEVTTHADDYRQLELSFTTSPNTRRVRYILDTLIGTHYTEGHVTYDDASLTIKK